MAEAALYEEYKSRVIDALRSSQGYTNLHQVPKVTKVVVNTCINAGLADYKQALEDAKNELTTITGQKPAETRSKKSIANFKLRENQAIGAKVTLRGAFDGRGNYTLGVSDQSIFPEIELDKVKRTIGFDVCIVTTANSDGEAKALLKELGMPFADKGREKKAPAAPAAANA